MPPRTDRSLHALMLTCRYMQGSKKGGETKKPQASIELDPDLLQTELNRMGSCDQATECIEAEISLTSRLLNYFNRHSSTWTRMEVHNFARCVPENGSIIFQGQCTLITLLSNNSNPRNYMNCPAPCHCHRLLSLLLFWRCSFPSYRESTNIPAFLENNVQNQDQ